MATATTFTPTEITAEEAAEKLGVDVFYLGVTLRQHAKEQLEMAAHAVGGEADEDAQEYIERAHASLSAAQACEVAWRKRGED